MIQENQLTNEELQKAARSAGSTAMSRRLKARVAQLQAAVEAERKEEMLVVSKQAEEVAAIRCR